MFSVAWPRGFGGADSLAVEQPSVNVCPPASPFYGHKRQQAGTSAQVCSGAGSLLAARRGWQVTQMARTSSSCDGDAAKLVYPS